MNNQLRLSFNNADGSRAALSRDGSVRDFYKILVNEEYKERAGRILAEPMEGKDGREIRKQRNP